MAEIALGGIEIAIRSTRNDAKTCAHTATLSTISSGIERAVCEDCGHLSVRFHHALAGPVERDQFARPADDVEEVEETTTYPSPTARYTFGTPTPDKPEVFAHRPHLQVQRRLERENRVLSLRG
jgi:hypothetical protein